MNTFGNGIEYYQSAINSSKSKVRNPIIQMPDNFNPYNINKFNGSTFPMTNDPLGMTAVGRKKQT